jgi:beta-lactamase class A
MRCNAASLAWITLLLATALPCAWSQTAQPIPLQAPQTKPSAKPQHINLDSPKPAEEPPKAQPTEIKQEAPPPPEAPVKSFAPAPVFDAALEQQIRKLVTASHTKVALYAWQLNTSKAIAIDADQPIQTNSVVHLALLWESLRQIALGDINWDDTIKSTTLHEATSRMLLTGDTTVPAMLVDRFTTKRVNQDLTTFGYDGPWQKPAAPRTTPRQMVRLLQHIAMCDLDLPKQLHVNVDRAEAACNTASTMLRDHLYFAAAPTSNTAQTFLLATESGPIVIAIYGEDAARLTPSITQAILTAWSPEGFDATQLDKLHLGVSWE